MYLPVCHVFELDLDALKTLFLHDQEPMFPGLRKTAHVLSSLLNVVGIHINIRPNEHVSDEHSSEDDTLLHSGL